MLRFHNLERGVLERSSGGDAGVGDDDVHAAKGEDGFVKRGVDLAFVGHVDMRADRHVLAEAACERRRRASPGSAASMSASTTQAPSPISRAAIARPMPPAPPVTSATRPASALRLRHALELGLLEQPVFDIERFLLRQARRSGRRSRTPRITLIALT